jgi:hypothetical protein
MLAFMGVLPLELMTCRSIATVMLVCDVFAFLLLEHTREG